MRYPPVIAGAIGDNPEANLASVCHERDASIVTAFSPVLLLEQHYDRGTFPLLRYALPYGDHSSVDLFY